jgi:hypothetical protein
MRHRTLVASFVVAAAAAGVLATVDARGPEPLFNGKDLTGWTVVNGKAPYQVVDGVIVGTTIADSPNSFLATDRTYKDFILELEVKQEIGPSNSGVQFRGQRRADYQNGRVHGYQCEIDPSERAWTGGIYDEARRNWLYQGDLHPAGQKAYKFGEWNRIRIEAIGTSLRTFVNDVPVAYVIDDVDAEGFIALQVHAIQKPDEAGRKVMFRNIRIQTTDLTPSPVPNMYIRNMLPNNLSGAEKAQGWQFLFDGTSTDAWRGAMKTAFPDKGWLVKGGELSVQKLAEGRGGDIVTKEEFGPFDFQAEFKLTPGANSGIKYYVSEKTGAALGLEYQLLDDEKHPDAKMGIDGNRTLASLYDVMPSAKRVFGRVPTAPSAVDTWHHVRIVATTDGKVQHWLNGFNVLEYVRGSDAFKAHIAASKFKDVAGFGLGEQGRFLLQDHGDTVYFRNIKVRRLQ